MATMLNDFVMTMDSDLEDVSDSKDSRRMDDGRLHLDVNFTFDISGNTFVNIADEGHYPDDLIRKGSKPVRRLMSYTISIAHVNYFHQSNQFLSTTS